MESQPDLIPMITPIGLLVGNMGTKFPKCFRRKLVLLVGTQVPTWARVTITARCLYVYARMASFSPLGISTGQLYCSLYLYLFCSVLDGW